MKQRKPFAVTPGLAVLFADLGIDLRMVLRRAQLRGNLLREHASFLSADEYFRLWRALEAEAHDPLLPIRIGEHLSTETFDPPIFAALCSPNLNAAASRIATYKKLISPVRLLIDRTSQRTTITYAWPDGIDPPQLLVVTELLFWISLVRIATRERVVPLKVAMIDPPENIPAYHDFAGVAIGKSSVQKISFSAADADCPFLTANEDTWNFFEPDLRAQLVDMDKSATMTDLVQTALFELLPAGAHSIDDVAFRLAMSSRSLQRKLQKENVTFQEIRVLVRERLARHYLINSSLTSNEISFLLGYDDPTSFYRAFRSWTGQSPNMVRAVAP